MSIREEMNAEKFRTAALRAMEEIHSRGKTAIVVGGSGLYIKALTHGLAVLPQVDPDLRAKLNAMSIDELRSQLVGLDQESARKIDTKNRRRLVRALEICLTTGKRASEQRAKWAVADLQSGFFVLRDREELCERINQRVEAMFENNVIEEVRAVGAVSPTASQMIGLREIRELLTGKMSILQCVAAIQQATRRYAKRQLTWFRRQPNFEPLNLSLLAHNEAVKWILLRTLSERRELSGVRPKG
jgi:tRNA dimethylallyltransferase